MSEEYPLAWPWLAEMLKESPVIQGGRQIMEDEDQNLAGESIEKLAADEASDGQSGLVGRELDAAVGRLMGYPKEHGDDGEGWCDHCGEEDITYRRMRFRQQGGVEPTETQCLGKEYSTDIVAAMEVLDKADGMWELTRCVEREVLDDDSTPYVLRYMCRLRFGNNLGSAAGCATPMEAISRAALAAVSTQGEMISK